MNTASAHSVLKIHEFTHRMDKHQEVVKQWDRSECVWFFCVVLNQPIRFLAAGSRELVCI